MGRAPRKGEEIWKQKEKERVAEALGRRAGAPELRVQRLRANRKGIERAKRV